MILLAIDPGTASSGAVLVDTRYKPPKIERVYPEIDNNRLIKLIQGADSAEDQFDGRWVLLHAVVIEHLTSMGMEIGASTMETIWWSGRLYEATRNALLPVHTVSRKDIKLHLCGTSRAKDKNIRQAIIDMYPATGAGKVPQIGTKNHPGPLYGMSKHAWAALAVAIAWQYQQPPCEELR